MTSVVIVDPETYPLLSLSTGLVRLAFLLAPAPIAHSWTALVTAGKMPALHYVGHSLLQVAPFLLGYVATKRAWRNAMLVVQLWLLLQMAFQLLAIWLPLYQTIEAPMRSPNPDSPPTLSFGLLYFPYAQTSQEFPVPRGYFNNSMAVLRMVSGLDPEVVPDTAHLVYAVGLVMMTIGYEAAKKDVDKRVRIQAAEEKAAAAAATKREANDSSDDAEVEAKEEEAKKSAVAETKAKTTGSRASTGKTARRRRDA
ncbi:hypothetical protein H9P43_000866 [Blastocladiella emersonii ATCC 22665]|nr:hypothetical protein H9P43_000866 [Blastocladiella emersonii ATCC 22665]